MTGSWRRIGAVVGLAALVVAAATVVSFAQAETDFKPIRADQAALEQLPATPFVFWAYAIVWMVLLAYVFSLWRRLGRVEQEMAALSNRLAQPRR
jgi:CcmD family protein